MTWKKIDWLRHLYHGSTKWEHGLSGQIHWGELGQRDPNNGGKYSVAKLEELLPNKLQTCLDNGKVPKEYLPEVRKCIAYICKEEKFDSKVISRLSVIRKECIKLFECCIELKEFDINDIIAKLDHSDLEDLQASLHSLRSSIQNVDNSAGNILEEVGRVPEKKFKTIDWLRHIFLACQKWQYEVQGQLNHKVTNAKDPNNNKDGSRMKREELVDSLKRELPLCIREKKVPMPYMAEVKEVIHGSLDSAKLEKEQTLRKIAINLMSSLPNLGDLASEVISICCPSKVKVIADGLALLGDALSNRLQVAEAEPVEIIVETENVIVVNEVEDVFENLLDGEVSNSGSEIKPESPKGDSQIDLYPEGLYTDDGTSELEKLLDQAEANVPTPSNEEVLSPVSTLGGSDGHSSDDSGFYSPSHDLSHDPSHDYHQQEEEEDDLIYFLPNVPDDWIEENYVDDLDLQELLTDVKEKENNSRVVFLLSLSVAREVVSEVLACDRCRGVENPRDCLNVTTCGSSEICHIKKYAGSDQQTLYDLGCLDTSVCEVLGVYYGGNSEAGQTVLWNRCCNTSYCNMNYDVTKSGGRPCFNCYAVTDPASRNTFDICDMIREFVRITQGPSNVTASPGDNVTASPGDNVTASPGNNVTASPGDNVTASPGNNVTASPGNNVTASPGNNVTASPGDNVTASPGDNVTASPGDNVTASPGDNVTASPGDNVAFTCQAAGFLVPSVLWFFKDGRNVLTELYTVVTLTPSDSQLTIHQPVRKKRP